MSDYDAEPWDPIRVDHEPAPMHAEPWTLRYQHAAEPAREVMVFASSEHDAIAQARLEALAGETLVAVIRGGTLPPIRRGPAWKP